MPHHALTGHVTPADRARAPVAELPFHVPAGTTRIEVSYAFDEGNTLDLGLADPRFGPFPAEGGFRGWSGGARRRVFVARDEATPGYLPGPVPEGTWHVLLGLAHVAPGGCDYRVDIALDDRPRPDPAPLPAPAPSGGAPGWYAGDLQAHTHHSDAGGSLDDLAEAATGRGLDFVAVTDHNTVSHHRAIARRAGPPLLIPGEEVTTYHGHANVWGARDWVDFRASSDAAIARVAARAHALGGLFSVNHPKTQPDCLGCDWSYDVPRDADAFEAWQGPWPHRNWESLARYDAQLAAGRRLTLVGGSDRHQPTWPDPDPPVLRVGSPTTWLWAEELSVPALLDALKRGRACVGESPDGPRVMLSGPDATMGDVLPSEPPVPLRAEVHDAAGDTLRWVGPDGPLRTVPIEGPAFEDAWTVPDPPAFVRLEVVARDPDATAHAFAAALGAAAPHDAATWAEVRRHPWVRGLSNPLYFARQGMR